MAIPDQPVGASSAPDDQFALGAALAERYRVERELGAGGMATVYLAEDLKHHRKVAIKGNRGSGEIARRNRVRVHFLGDSRSRLLRKVYSDPSFRCEKNASRLALSGHRMRRDPP